MAAIMGNLTKLFTIFIPVCLAVVVAQVPHAQAGPKGGAVRGITEALAGGTEFQFGGNGGMNRRCADEFGESAYQCTCEQATRQPDIKKIVGDNFAWCENVITSATFIYNPDNQMFYATKHDVTGFVGAFRDTDAAIARIGTTLNCGNWRQQAGNGVGMAVDPTGELSGLPCRETARVLCCGPP